MYIDCLCHFSAFSYYITDCANIVAIIIAHVSNLLQTLTASANIVVILMRTRQQPITDWLPTI